ncbi:hypothetical protein C4K39_0751 [Pseudomonas sessilinigenes]|nr:hypothetical protein C4K39_0751 [Pseudomonas sessilinigenes]
MFFIEGLEFYSRLVRDRAALCTKILLGFVHYFPGLSIACSVRSVVERAGHRPRQDFQ